MKRLLLIVLLLAAPAAAAERPRLAVLIVVDQMRAEYLDAFIAKGPLSRRLAGATVFANAAHDHVPTETATGHAAIATGRPPSGHGIISNDFFDRKTRTLRAAFRDERRGLGPFSLKARTIADAVRAADRDARVVSIAVKDRAAIPMGGQKPDAAVWYDQNRQRFVTAPHYGELPAWAEAVNEELPGLVKNITPPFSQRDFRASPAADRAVLNLSTRAIAALKLGGDDACDLLVVNFSATDYIGHRWGPDADPLRRQLAALEGTVEALLQASAKASGGRMVAALTSDHGVTALPESAAGRRAGLTRILTRDFVSALEEALQRGHPAKGRKWVLGLQLPDVYLNRELARSRRIPWNAFVKDAARRLAALPMIAATFVPGEPSSDPYARVYRRSYLEGASGDLQVRTSPDILVTRWPTGTSHGSPYDVDALVPLVFFGAGGKPARIERRVSVESVAPTLAQAMGVSFPAGDAPVLAEALPR